MGHKGNLFMAMVYADQYVDDDHIATDIYPKGTEVMVNRRGPILNDFLRLTTEELQPFGWQAEIEKCGGCAISIGNARKLGLDTFGDELVLIQIKE